MIELGSIPHQKPGHRRATTVQLTPRDRKLPKARTRPMTMRETREALVAKLEEMRADMTMYVQAWFAKHEGAAYDFKEIKKTLEWQRKVLFDFGRRLSALEKGLAPRPVNPEHPGSGHWRPPTPAAASPAPIPPRPPEGYPQRIVTREEVDGRMILTCRQAARRVGRVESTVRNAARARQIPSYIVDGRLRFDAEELDEWRKIPRVAGTGFYSRHRAEGN